MLTGCALAPGAYLDPSSRNEKIPFNLVELSESTVNPEPVTRRQLVDTLSEKTNEPYHYLLGPHDVLGIRVWNNPGLSTPSTAFNANNQTLQNSNDLIRQRQQPFPEGVEIESDGTFFFPFAKSTVAAGKTVTQVREELTKKLSQYLRDPQVSVRILEFNSQKAQIIGEVKFPRPLPITSKPLRVLDAIALAEGLKDSADKAEAAFISGTERKTIDMARLLDGDMSQNYLLKDGDIINIDSNRYRQIVIMGEVNSPVAMPYDQRGMSLNDALVAASGINQMYANAKGIYILRNNSSAGDPSTIFRLNMQNATSLLLAERFPLHAKDVIYVDTAGISRWNRVVSQLLPTANGVNSVIKN